MIRRLRPARVVFDGQSRVRSPSGADPWTVGALGWSWPRIAMGMLADGIPWHMPAVAGQSFTWLADNFVGRADRVTSAVEPTVVVLCGGFTDYGAEGDTGAQVYADAGALAGLYRAHGADYVVCTTTLPAVPIAGAAETERQAGNALILDDANQDAHFDAVVDLEVDGLDDPTDTASYFDGTHIFGGPRDLAHGTGRAADIAAPFIAAAIAAVTGA